MDAELFLIRRMKQGEEEAFDAFVRRYYEDVLKYCAYRCGNVQSAEDLTQETFVRFFSGFSDYHYRGKTKNYLYTIAGNLCRNYFKQTREFPEEDEMLEQKAGSVSHMAEEVEGQILIDWALSQLPSELFEVARMYYLLEMKQSEIAKNLKIRLPLVKYRLRRAKQKLQMLLREEEENGKKKSTGSS